MRAFIAIELSQEIKSTLSILQQSLQKTKADVKWVEPQNIHLTLKFLGDINEAQLNQISGILDEAAKLNPAYSIRISELGAFPEIENPRVIWAGVDHGDSQTKQINRILEKRLSSIGIPKEKNEFSAHITIGRVRSGKNRIKLSGELKRLNVGFTGKELQMQVSKILLFESKLSPKGPAYAPLKEANLKTT